jgi:hypothetical protein
VTVSANIAQVDHVGSPRFTVCPDQSGSACNLGKLPSGQSDELQVSVRVRKAATLGEQIKLVAKVNATGATAAQASAAAVVIAAASPPSSAIPPPTDTLPPVSLPPLPDLGTSPSDPAGLFPTVSPDPSASPSPGAAAAAGRGRDRVRAVAASATLPLSPRLIGGQLAGLAVLACAIAIAIARLSLRAPRPQDGPQDGKNALR